MTNLTMADQNRGVDIDGPSKFFGPSQVGWLLKARRGEGMGQLPPNYFLAPKFDIFWLMQAYPRMSQMGYKPKTGYKR